MGEDDIMELLCKSGQVVPSSQTQRPTSDPPPILGGSGSGTSGCGEGIAPFPLPPPLHHQNLFSQEDEMSTWLHHLLRQYYFCSELLYSGIASTLTTHPQSSVVSPPPTNAPYGQIIAATRTENFMNFPRLRENIFSGGRVEAGLSMQVGSNATPSSSATESYLKSATHGPESRATFIGGVSRTFAVPSLGRKEKTVCEIAGTSSSGTETELVEIQPATETEIAEGRERKEREDTIAGIQGTEEARGSTSRKRSRAAEMHNLAERRRREKINEKMKTLQELIPRCNKSDKASMLDDVIEYVKWLQMQIEESVRDMPPPFIPFFRPAHMAGVGPSYPAPCYPFPNTQASDPSSVHLPSSQPTPVSNQPQFPAYMNSQFVGLHQMQQPPPPLQSQTTSQPLFDQASSSKEPEDQD